MNTYIEKTANGYRVVFPATGRVWGLSKASTLREMIVLSLFALEQWFPSLEKVIGTHYLI